MKLSDTLREMRDQFRGYEIVDGQVLISGEALSSLVETLDMAHRAALRLEQGRSGEHRRRPVLRLVPGGRNADPRHAGGSRPQVETWTPWSAGRNTPDDGGSAA